MTVHSEEAGVGWGREITSYLVDPVLGRESKALTEAERRSKRWII